MYDMTGNVWEWNNDLFTEDTLLTSSTPLTGPTTGEKRQARHSGFMNNNTLTYRNSGSSPTARNNDLGFRVVRTK